MPNKSQLLIVALAALVSLTARADSTAPRKTLRPFASESELAAVLKDWAQQRRRALGDERRRSAASLAAASPAKAEAAGDSITNVQHAGVDEGGIVKLHGNHLVILRRGRLFTVSVDKQNLKPVSAIDAFGPDIDPAGAWYDEMLIWRSTIAVIGYSYARGGTEIGLFEISPGGTLAYRATYHLRSNDYYSSRNYASRLIGSKLVFYSPLYLNPWHANPLEALPAMRRWRGAAGADFKRIAPATRIYRSDEPLDPAQGIALHSVSICDLARPELACEASAVLGPAGRVFYVSPQSVFVWTEKSALFRIPLDGSAPSALKVSGTPIDQFSFLEGADGFLNVLVRSEGRGEAMWAAEHNAGALALLRVSLASFSDGRERAPRESYRRLPKPAGGWALQNRYVGDYLLYGAGAGWHRPQRTLHSQAYAVRYAGDATAHAVPLAHAVDRIEALGAGAVIVGSDGRDLHFTSLRLGAAPAASDRYTRKDASQGETRSHSFYYRAESEQQGVIGLPIIGGKRSASLLYLRNHALALSEVGTLDSRPLAGNHDGCRASCVDWYGNSQPLFVKNRVFALMGYEIVEGELHNDRIAETRRVSFAPQRAYYSW